MVWDYDCKLGNCYDIENEFCQSLKEGESPNGKKDAASTSHQFHELPMNDLLDVSEYCMERDDEQMDGEEGSEEIEGTPRP